jgi:ABC-type transporter Mla MlaB component
MTPVFKYAGGSCLISGQPVFNSLDNLSKELLAEAGKSGEMVIDLKEVSDCDSAFVALLTACLQIKKQQQQSLVLNNSPKKLLAMLDVYGLADCGLTMK